MSILIWKSKTVSELNIILSQRPYFDTSFSGFTLKVEKGIKSESVTVQNESDLFGLINNVLDDPIKQKAKTSELFNSIGLFDTNTILDDRTIALMNLYTYYNSNATPSAPFENLIWFDAVTILEQTKPRLF